LILAYLIAGFIIGPFGAAWIKSQEPICIISELGFTSTLFIMGLEIDLKKIFRAGHPVRRRRLGGCLLGIGSNVTMRS
jgi:Kef-type K+ transport system membrane component KefB